MANFVYDSYKEGLMKWEINLNDWGDVIKVALFTSSYTPDQATDAFFGDITWESEGVGYTTWGSILWTKTITVDNNVAKFDWADITWTEVSLFANSAVMYKYVETEWVFDPTASPLIAYFDFWGTKTASEGDFKIIWNADGIITIE